MELRYLVPFFLYLAGLKTPTGLMNDFLDNLVKEEPWPVKPSTMVTYISEYQRGHRTESELRDLLWGVFLEEESCQIGK